MAYLMTHSLLSSWLYAMRDNPYADASQEDTSREDFLRVLRREPTPTTEAMQNGIDFENLVTALIKDQPYDVPEWEASASQIASILRGSQLQYVATKHIVVNGLELLLYGRLDALKAGRIYDIKFSRKYERGKFIDSTQHPMYLELVPEANAFSYLVSNGSEVWTETYRRDEVQPIIPIISNFLTWLTNTDNMPIYKQYWGARYE